MFSSCPPTVTGCFTSFGPGDEGETTLGPGVGPGRKLISEEADWLLAGRFAGFT